MRTHLPVEEDVSSIHIFCRKGNRGRGKKKKEKQTYLADDRVDDQSSSKLSPVLSTPLQTSMHNDFLLRQMLQFLLEIVIIPTSEQESLYETH
jgi:hypothetical protein